MNAFLFGLAMSSVLVAACGSSEPRFSAPMTLGGVEVSAEVLNQGARTFTMRCASCHGEDGSGNGAAGRALPEKPRDFREALFRYKSTPGDALPTDEDLAWVIKRGKVDNGMPANPGLTEQDVHALVQYIKTFSPRWTSAGPQGE